MNKPNVVSIIEKENNVVELFKYQNTSAWIAIKVLLTNHLYDKNIRLEMNKQKDLISFKGFKFILLSLKHVVNNFNKPERHSLYLGASTGLFIHDNKVLDAYFPYYDIAEENTTYTMNCGNLNELNYHTDYIKKHKVIIDNYIFGVLKKILSKLLSLNKKHTVGINKFSKLIQKYNIDIETCKIENAYLDFIAGYHIYKLYFKFLPIKKAYIVSPTTKSDICAALKNLDIEIIEIQHGTAGKTHRGYNYNFQPTILMPVPDKINVYNQFWKDEILNAGYFKASQIDIVGRLKYDIVQDSNTDLDFDYIVFTGQGAFFQQIVTFFKEADRALTEKGIKLFYKSHPRELPTEIEYLEKELASLNSCYFYNGNKTTEELIKYSFAHISVFSSCHFDAIYYNDKTFILDIMEDNIMHYYAMQHPKKFIEIKSISEVLKS